MLQASGTTSAHAENTCRSTTSAPTPWNYLRVRGEYDRAWHPYAKQWELPPRARRIRVGRHPGQAHPGTTSACAENTPERYHSHTGGRNYLRVRGEYRRGGAYRRVRRELPPRTRRIHGRRLPTRTSIGTTSAYAENTEPRPKPPRRKRNYLRVRGEY